MTPVEILMASIPIIGAIFGSAISARNHLDSQFDSIRDRLLKLAEHDAVERERIDGRLAMLEYRVGNNAEAIQRESRRFEVAIGQIAGYLRKDGFGVRESCLYWPSDDNPLGPSS